MRERQTGLRAASLVRHAELVDETLQALRLFQWIQVLALDVLDQRHRRGGFVRHVAHQHRHAVQPGQARGAEAALAGDDLVALRLRAGARERPHEDRLHDALAADAFRQLVQRALVHAGARLVLAGLHLRELQRGGLHRAARAGAGVSSELGAEQGFEAHAGAPLQVFRRPCADCRPRKLTQPLRGAARIAQRSSRQRVCRPSGQSPSPESLFRCPRGPASSVRAPQSAAIARARAGSQNGSSPLMTASAGNGSGCRAMGANECSAARSSSRSTSGGATSSRGPHAGGLARMCGPRGHQGGSRGCGPPARPAGDASAASEARRSPRRAASSSRRAAGAASRSAPRADRRTPPPSGFANAAARSPASLAGPARAGEGLGRGRDRVMSLAYASRNVAWRGSAAAERFCRVRAVGPRGARRSPS